MPHLVILYTPNLDPEARHGSPVPGDGRHHAGAARRRRPPGLSPGGTRVLAYPATHYAVSDGGATGIAAGRGGDYAFVYLNLRMASGRTDATQKRAGDALLARAKAHLSNL
jgi:5-carboxymethyl-2-hydroxymuconate isomerase